MAGEIASVAPDLASRFDTYVAEEEVAPIEEAAPEAEAEASAPAEEVVETNEESQETGGEDAGESEGDEPVVADSESGEPESEPIDTFAELAEHYEVEPDDLLNHIQIEGKDGEMVSLATAVNGYRGMETFDARKSAEIQTLTAEIRTTHDASMKDFENLTAQMIQKIQRNQEPEGGWDHLRSSNPGEYIRLNEERQAERADAEAAIALMDQQRQKVVGENEAAMDRFRADQHVQLLKMKPEWEGEAGNVAKTEIVEYLKATGRQSEVIDNLRDLPAQDILTVWEAAQYRKMTTDPKLVRKRLRGLPLKHMKASARDEDAPQRAQQKANQATRDNFRESGKIEDGLELFERFI